MDMKPINEPHIATSIENQTKEEITGNADDPNTTDIRPGDEANEGNANITTDHVTMNKEDAGQILHMGKSTVKTTKSDGVSDVDPQQSAHEDVTALMNNKLQTISQYMSLVENKKNHAMLLKDSTITGFLVLCLGDDIPEIAEKSFQVFLSLSKYEDNLPIIKKLDYVMDALRCIASNALLKEAVRNDAKNLLSDMKSSLKSHVPLAEQSDSTKNVMVSKTAQSNSVLHEKADKNVADLNTTMSTMKRKNKGRETILFLENDVIQNRKERAKITQVLIGVPGIISVTYDLKKNFCIVRGKRQVLSEIFGRAVAALELANVYLIRKNENKEEVKTLIPATDKENVVYPTYPEEQENDEIDNSAAVAKTDQLPGDGTSFFKSAKNFIKRSFYW